MAKKKKKAAKIVLNGLMVVLGVVILGGSYYLISTFREQAREIAKNDALVASVVEEADWSAFPNNAQLRPQEAAFGDFDEALDVLDLDEGPSSGQNAFKVTRRVGVGSNGSREDENEDEAASNEIKAADEEKDEGRKDKSTSDDSKPKAIRSEQDTVLRVLEPDENYDPYLHRKIDFETLKSQNADTWGWIYLPETKLDYPVVLEPVPGQYKYDLTGFDGVWNGAGTPLIPRAEGGEVDFRLLILAHRMVDYYGDDDWLFSHLPQRWGTIQGAMEHPYVYTYTPEGAVRWKVWAQVPAYGNDMIYRTPYLEGTEEYQDFLDHVEEMANYTWGPKPTKYTRTLMMSTCSRGSDPANYGRHALVLRIDAERNAATGRTKLYSKDGPESRSEVK